MLLPLPPLPAANSPSPSSILNPPLSSALLSDYRYISNSSGCLSLLLSLIPASHSRRKLLAAAIYRLTAAVVPLGIAGGKVPSHHFSVSFQNDVFFFPLYQQTVWAASQNFFPFLSYFYSPLIFTAQTVCLSSPSVHFIICCCPVFVSVSFSSRASNRRTV